MKKITLLFFFASVSAIAQKSEKANFNTVQNIEATDYAITYTSNYSKVFDNKDVSKILFMNTETNKVNEVFFEKKTSIRDVNSTIEANFLGSRFILIECYTEVEKKLPKASNTVKELYLITLNDFKLTKISSDNFSLRSWDFNKRTNKIIFIEQENGYKDSSGELQKIMLFDLEKGTTNEIFSNN